MNKTKFSIIGNGYFIKVFDKAHPLYIRLKADKEADIMDYIYDYNSLGKLELKDEFGNLYNSFHEIKPSKLFTAYSIDNYTRLEIKSEKYKPIKLFFKDLIVDWLFPPNFTITNSILENEGLIVIETDKGFFGKTKHLYQFEKEDELAFDIITIPGLNVKAVKSIKVNGNQVILKQPDTLNYGIYGFMI